MRLKSFTAKTMSEAMQMVREALGEEAVIVATREEKGGKQVRVTAAVEQSADRPDFADEVQPERKDWLQYDSETDDEDYIAEELTEILLKHSVPADVLDHVISTALTLGLSSPRIALMAALEHLYSYKALPTTKQAKALMTVGVPGAGKTLAIAKMAAKCVENDLNAVVVTTDLSRAGGVPQLEAFTKLMGLPLEKARSAKDLKAALADHKGADQILIDTPGISAFDPYEMKDLAKFMGVGAIESVLVMPAGGDPDESGEIARAFSILGVSWMLPTKTDISRRMGGLLTAAHKGGMAFADISNTSAVADGLVSPTPEYLADLMIPQPSEGSMKLKNSDILKKQGNS